MDTFHPDADRSDSDEAVQLRQLMVETQLKTRDIHDPKVLKVMGKVPRHLFGIFESLEEAYSDSAYGIACQQTISQPYIVASMTQELEIRPEHKILEVGTGSGYQTAVLAELCPNIYSIERHQDLSEKASTLLTQLGYTTIRFYVGDGAKGLPEEAPFDRILVAAAASAQPITLLQQLSPRQGIMVFPMETGEGQQELLKIIRHSESHYETKRMGGVRFVPLVTDGS
jgi:protein-L-isoaspartate(D-aspartate) O-methyltransferase